MKAKIVSFVSLSLVAFSGCDKQESTVSRDPIVLTTEQKQVVASSNSFGLHIFKEIAENTPEGQNIFISPLSISMALSMLYNGAAGTTSDELRDGLGYVGLSDENINKANKDLIEALINADPKVMMEIANSIWYKNSFTVEDNFLATNKEYLNADVRSANFDSNTKDLINAWVKSKTHEKITSIVEEIPDEAIMYLINAIYFKGIWQYKFDPKSNQKLNFMLSNGNKKQTDFMVQEGSFEYMQNDLFTAVDLPYGDGRYSMMVLRPNDGKTYKDILSAMNEQSWSTWNNSLRKVDKIKISFPKFKISFKKELNDDLKALGMKSMFDVSANLTRINPTAPLAVSKVMHKTFVEVNEEGTEAAAVTSVEIVLTSNGSGGLAFTADKPFVYFIREKDSKTILFTGIMNEPLIEN
jgi:serpin B